MFNRLLTPILGRWEYKIGNGIRFDSKITVFDFSFICTRFLLKLAKARQKCNCINGYFAPIKRLKQEPYLVMNEARII